MLPRGYVGLLDADYTFLPVDFDDDVIYISESPEDVCQTCGREGSVAVEIYVNEDTGRKRCFLCDEEGEW